MAPFSLLVLRLFCFIFVFAFTEGAALGFQSFFVLRYMHSINRPSKSRRPDSHTHTRVSLFFSFCLFGDAAFSEYFVYHCRFHFSLYGEYAVRSFLPNGVFLPCDHELDFFYFSLLLRENSINQLTATTHTDTTCFYLFFLLFFFSLRMTFFPSIFVSLPFSLLCIESTSYVFPFRMVFFYLVTTDWIFDIRLIIWENSNKSIKTNLRCTQSLKQFHHY